MKFYQLLSTSCLLEVLIFWRILNLNRLPTKTNKCSFFKHYKKYKVNKKRVKKICTRGENNNIESVEILIQKSYTTKCYCCYYIILEGKT